MPERFSSAFGWSVLRMKLPAGGGCRPGLPKDICRRERLASGDVGFGDQDVDGVELGRLGLGFGRLVRTASQHGGNATCCYGDSQHDDTCGFHTLTLTMTERPVRPRKITWPPMRPLTPDFTS